MYHALTVMRLYVIGINIKHKAQLVLLQRIVYILDLKNFEVLELLDLHMIIC